MKKQYVIIFFISIVLVILTQLLNSFSTKQDEAISIHNDLVTISLDKSFQEEPKFEDQAETIIEIKLASTPTRLYSKLNNASLIVASFVIEENKSIDDVYEKLKQSKTIRAKRLSNKIIYASNTTATTQCKIKLSTQDVLFQEVHICVSSPRRDLSQNILEKAQFNF